MKKIVAFSLFNPRNVFEAIRFQRPISRDELWPIISIPSEEIHAFEARISILHLDIISDPISYFSEGVFLSNMFIEKVRHVFELPADSLPKVTQRILDRGKTVEDPGIIFFEGINTGFKPKDIFEMQTATLEHHQKYADAARHLIDDEPGGVFVDPVYTVPNSEIMPGWRVAVSSSPYPVAQPNLYFLSTTADVAKLPSLFKKVTSGSTIARGVTFGGLHPCFRYEERLESGWRDHIFPQFDIETICFRPNQDQQQHLDVSMVSKLIEGLRSFGFLDHQIKIRVNDHYGILFSLFQKLNLDKDTVTRLQSLFDETAKASVLNRSDLADLQDNLLEMLGSLEIPESIKTFFRKTE